MHVIRCALTYRLIPLYAHLLQHGWKRTVTTASYPITSAQNERPFFTKGFLSMLVKRQTVSAGIGGGALSAGAGGTVFCHLLLDGTL